jgi:hypothetical protein
MTSMTSIRIAIAVTASAVVTPVLAQKGPAVDDVLRAAGEYVTEYTSRASGVTLEEGFTMRDLAGGRVGHTMRISSDLVLLNLKGTLIALRDPFAIDGKPLRERAPRIMSALAEPSQAAWSQAQAHAAEFIRYFQHETVLRVSEPALALRFVAPENQARSTFRLDGRKRFSGVETVGLRFQETKRAEADYVVATQGHALGSGRMWVDPATGRVHQTELWMQSPLEFVRITVDYAREDALDLWLPASAVQTFEISEMVGSGISEMGGGLPGVARRSIEVRATYTNPRHTPLDLSGGKQPSGH